uniref:Bet v I/Major latex protein domain-containing protein n=1 Tax=Salix viminalis TaxID=40686 RepID=A0A6N2KRI5_SALVM
MVLQGILETEIEIMAPAAKFFNIFRNQNHHIPNISDSIHAIELHEGDWETPGSVKQWTYTLDGNTPLSVKETVEEVDEQNKRVKFNCFEGEVLNEFKSFRSTVQVTPKDGEGSLVKWTIEFEKLNEDIPSPDAYLELVQKLTKDIDDHLVKP